MQISCNANQLTLDCLLSLSVIDLSHDLALDDLLPLGEGGHLHVLAVLVSALVGGVLVLVVGTQKVLTKHLETSLRGLILAKETWRLATGETGLVVVGGGVSTLVHDIGSLICLLSQSNHLDQADTASQHQLEGTWIWSLLLQPHTWRM